MECGTYVRKDKRHVFVGKGAPSGGECGFIFVSSLDSNLIASKRTTK
jgi:hypothetical protein